MINIEHMSDNPTRSGGPRPGPRPGSLEAIRRAQEQVGRWQAELLRQVAAWAGAQGVTRLEDIRESWVWDELVCELRLSRPGADELLLDALRLQRLPVVLAALESGELTLRHVRVLLNATVSLTNELVDRVVDAVLPFASELSVAAFRRKTEREVQRVAPATAEEQHVLAVAERRVVRHVLEHGMAEIYALLPADAAATVWTAVQALADTADTADARTADQRRADALTQLACTVLTGEAPAQLPGRHRMAPAIQVTVNLSTLLGYDAEPGDLAGHGPIPADLARRLAVDTSGTLRRLITDPVGRLVDYGRTVYRPPAGLADHVLARDVTCRFPHCSAPARRCDIDHLQAWADGGETNDANLHLLCHGHHRQKHEGGWSVRLRDDGTAEWTSPSGRTYLVPPYRYPTAEPSGEESLPRYTVEACSSAVPDPCRRATR